MGKSSIARHTGGGGNESQGRQGFLSKTPFFKIFSNSKFSVSNNVGWGFHPNKNNEFQKSNGCHPELAAPFFADEKEAYKGGGSQSISGSSHRQKCSVICTQKSKVGLKAQPTKAISYASRKAQRHVRGDLVPAFTLAEVFSPYYNSPRKVAFTLAEVLITLGIIGVVAAMTLPTLVANYKEKQRVTQLKKSYSILQQAYLRAVEKHGEAQYWDLTVTQTGEDDENGDQILDYSGAEKVLGYIAESLNSQKPKTELKYNSYFLDGRLNVSGQTQPPEKYVYLNDNTILAVGYVNSDGDGYIDNTDFVIIFPECIKRGCKMGVDIFYFKLLYDKGFVPTGSLSLPTNISTPFEQACNRKSTNQYNGRACTAWVIFNENMDYLHCDDLSWSGKHKCK